MNVVITNATHINMAVVVAEYDYAHAYAKAKGCTLDEYYANLINQIPAANGHMLILNKLGHVYCESFDVYGLTYTKVFPVI